MVVAVGVVVVVVAVVRRRGDTRGRGRGGGDPQPQPFLMLDKRRRGQDLLRKHPRVAAHGEQVAQRGVVQRQVRVGDGTGREERVDALFGVERVVGLGVVVRGVEVEGLLLLLVRVELAADVLHVRVHLRGRGSVRGERGGALAARQALRQHAENEHAVDRGAPQHVVLGEVLERGNVVRLERARVGGQDGDPLFGRGRLPQLGAAAEEGNLLEGAVGVLSAALLLVDGGVAVAEEARREEPAAGLGVDPVLPSVPDAQGVPVRGEHGMAQEGRVLVQDL